MDPLDMADAKRGNTINPADLHTSPSWMSDFYDTFPDPTDPNSMIGDLATVDSGVDLTSYNTWNPVKTEPFEDYLDFSQVSNTPSPSADMIFSQANSPGDFRDFLRDQSHTSSSTPDTGARDTTAPPDTKPTLSDEDWKGFFQTPSDPIHIPQSLDIETPEVHLLPDKTKTRAETQIKVILTLDPLDDKVSLVHFPRKTLAKPKLLASVEERKEAENKGEILHMDTYLVCATAVEKKEQLEQALRRARGEENIPKRASGVAISEVEKDDPAHPQNGGEVRICEGCKERERKRYDRKKKRADDEQEWWSYEEDRIIMINEKEYKKWKDVDSPSQFSPRAKQVEFAMRIACYCRHQEEKSPVGYKVIFTFKDSAGNLVTQHTSEIFQITDDHKNKEILPEALSQSLPAGGMQQPFSQPQFAPQVVPVYQYPTQNQFQQAPPTPMSAAMNAFSQPSTPIIPNFQSPMSPVEQQYPQSATPTGPPRPPPISVPHSYSSASLASMASNASMPLANHPGSGRQAHFDAPTMSPTSQFSPEGGSFLPRPMSMDNFSFSTSYSYPQGFASAPQSSCTTPISLSRPASPTWEQNPNKKKMLKCVYFYVDDE